jgi:hypothetical protein
MSHSAAQGLAYDSDTLAVNALAAGHDLSRGPRDIGVRVNW